MALVDYSSSSSESSPPAAKKRRLSYQPLPALPAEFYDLYASNVRTSNVDDPSLHAGRERGSEHRPGGWPSHVYLEWICTDEYKLLTKLVNSFSSEVHSLLVNELDVPLPLHISLSAPLVLDTDNKDAFLNAISSRVEQARVDRFAISLANLAWEPNLDRSRWFLVLRVCRPKQDELNRLLSACNAVARQFSVAELYTEHQDTSSVDFSQFFHVSIAWRLTKPTPEDEKQLAAVEAELQHLQKISISFNSLKVKIGNKVTALSLSRGPTKQP